MPMTLSAAIAMDKGKRLGIVLRLLSLFFGFSVICLGAYLKSQDSADDTSVVDIFAYIMVASGFVLLLVGAFWSVFQGMRTNLYRRRGNSRRVSNQLFVLTVDRPSFYPPSYEESQIRGNIIIPMDRVCLGVAPPLYTASSSEAMSEDFSHELPPPYHLVMSQNPQNPDEPPQQDARPCQHNGSGGAVRQ